MVTVDLAKLKSDIDAFNSALAARHKLLGQRMPTIVKRQTGYLARTLINFTPPKNKGKLAQKINGNIKGKFSTVNNNYSYEDAAKFGGKNGDVIWFNWNKFAIYGIQKDADMRKASVDELYKFFLNVKVSKKGFQKVGQRGKQKVYISQRMVTKKGTVAELMKRIVGHIGRMKAGWSIGWEDCGSPGKELPGWVADHAGKANKARGYSISGLDTPDAPEFTIANTAAFLKENKAAEYMSRALQTRTKAMLNDIVFAIQQPDKWSEREAASNANAEE